MARLFLFALGALVLPWLTACATTTAPSSTARIVARYPHATDAFTEGLVIRGATLYESTGGYGQSKLIRSDLASGRESAQTQLASRYFGEGLALVGNRLYQLTWHSQIGFIYDADTLARIGSFHYAGEGWGLTWDGQHLIMSDGSDVLRVIDRRHFAVVRQIHVTENDQPVDDINELEYIDGEIWANIWFSDRIVRIDPTSGRVGGAIDAHDLRAALPAGTAGVLNGIAFDAVGQRLYITGKNWPRLFQLAYPP